MQTRAGYEGSIITATLEGLTDGFGVFAYYTGTQTYNEAQYGWESDDLKSTYAPNFMYNQRVWYNSALSSDYITKWTYSPIKYWPNEVQNGVVDDQDDNKSDNPASTKFTSADYANGGYVSFFAYAPYTYVTANNGVPKNTLEDNSTPWGTNYNSGATDGIVAISANNVAGDPKITYVIANDGNTVDLLWGTYDGTKENVVSETANNLGVAGNNNDADDATTAGDHAYDHSILKNYKLNADLTKQKTTGLIGFNFKHALAKVGGSTTVTDGGEAKNGFMVILDIDDQKGAEQGGSLVVNETKVTINSITITNDFDGDNATNSTVNGITENGYNQGIFNLATGQWGTATKANTGVMTHTVYSENSGSTGNAILNPAIAELYTSNTNVLYDENGKNINGGDGTKNYADFFDNTGTFSGQTGVLSAKKLAVYKGTEEANPLVFIPGTTPALKVTVDYIVRTKDANLAKGYSEVRQVISKLIQFTTPVELNKQYSLLMHLGLTSVKFTATVSDWDVAWNDDNGNGTLDVNEYIIKDVYLPRNVSELQSVSTSKNYVGSSSGTFQIPDVTLTYSDAADNITVSASDFATEKVTFASDAGWASINETTGVVTFGANESIFQRDATITVTRGNKTDGNFQTAKFTLRQKGASFTGLSLSLSPSEVGTASASTTATTTATYTHTTFNLTGASASTFTENVSATATYTLSSGDGTVSFIGASGNLTFNSEGTITVQASYTHSDTYDADEFEDSSVTPVVQTATASVTYTSTPAKRR